MTGVAMARRSVGVFTSMSPLENGEPDDLVFFLYGKTMVTWNVDIETSDGG